MSGPFRIRRAADTAVVRGAGPAESGLDDHWMARLTKLIPGEVLAVYLAGKSYAHNWIGTWAAVCLVLVIVVRAWGTKDPGRSPQWAGVGFSTISFVIWIYAMGDRLLAWQAPDPGIASAAVLVWTVLVPILYRGDISAYQKATTSGA